MQKRYTEAQRQQALQRLAEHNYNYSAAAAALGIPASTLQRWQCRHEARQQAAVPVARLLHETVGRAALRVAAAIEKDAPLDDVPLHQLGSVLAVLVDRFLRLSEAAPEPEEEQKIRVEYAYDGSIHKTPPWAAKDPGPPEAVHRSRLRQAFWQNGRGDDADYRGRADLRDADLVAGPDLPDGDAGLARSEDDSAERVWYDDG